MKHFTCFFLLGLLFSSTTLLAQKKSMVIGSMISRPNALLILNPPDANQGVLFPQLTTANRLLIQPTSPADDGLLVFDSTEKLFYYWKDNTWIRGLGDTIQNQNLSLSGNTLSITDGASVNLNGLLAAGQVSGLLSNLVIGPNTISSSNIQDGTVNTFDLTNLAVTQAKISDGAVTSAKLANTAVIPNTYGTATQVAQFTVDAQGRIINAGNVLITGVVPGGVAGGDLSGTYPLPTVAKLQGNQVSPGLLGAPDAGKLLVWNGLQWVPQIVPGVSPLVQSYNIDPSDFINLRLNDKKDKDNMVIFEDNTTFISVVKRDEGTAIIAPFHLPDGATIQQITLYYMDKDSRNITFDVNRKNLTGSNDNIITTWTSSVNSATILPSNHIPLPVKSIVDNSLYSYRVIVKFDPSNDTNDSNDADQRVYAVQIRYLP